MCPFRPFATTEFQRFRAQRSRATGGSVIVRQTGGKNTSVTGAGILAGCLDTDIAVEVSGLTEGAAGSAAV